MGVRVADLEMRSASTVHGLLQRSDDDTTSNNTKEGQLTLGAALCRMSYWEFGHRSISV